MKNIFYKILNKKLRLIANLILRRYKPKVVGVTGSVGKSSALSAIESVLGHSKKVRSSSTGFENAELSILMAILGDWKKKEGTLFWYKVILVSLFRLLIKSRKYPEVLILEYSVERPGDMKNLLDIVRPKIGVVTAMGETPTHTEFFPNKEAVAREKAKLINQLPATGFTFLNIDDPQVYDMKEKTRSHVITFGFSDNADLKITSFETNFNKDNQGISFKLNYGGSFIPVRLNSVLGKGQTYASAIAAGVGIVFDMNLVDISSALEAHKTPAGRMKIEKGVKETYIIDDTSEASPVSMEKAIEALSDIEANRKIVVLGDMLELGEYTLKAHQSIGKLVSKNIDKLITVGMRSKFIKKGAEEAGMKKESINHFDSVEEAGIFLQGEIKKGDVILVKASKQMKFNKIVKEVEEKTGS